MNLRKNTYRRMPLLLASMLVGAGLLGAADDANVSSPASSASATVQSQAEEIAQLKAAIAAQQHQLEMLQKAVERQQQALENTATASAQPAAPARLGTVASLSPVIPAPAASNSLAFPVAGPQAAPAAPPANPCEAGPDAQTPAYLRIGSVCVMPVGFMDMTAVWRDKNPGSGIGSNFANPPYNNVAGGNNSEFKFSPQNSRIGFRIDGNWKGAHFIGYNEFDFLGNSANGISVTNGAYVPRLRLFWVDVRKGKFEIMGGQSWSMLTPGRTGISPLPGNLFYSQAIDVNYVIGLTWTRQPGFRFVYHPSSTVAFGVALEQADSYIGGQAGAPTVTLPAAAALSGLAGTQLDNASSTGLNTPALHPDIIAKLAMDPSPKLHFEIAGIERTFKIWNSANNTHYSKVGGGLQFGANAEVMKGTRVITTNYYSDGGGKYLFGTVPDLIVRSDGSLSPIHAYGTVDGVETTIKNTLLYGYYGLSYAGRNVALDANGTTLIGYGYKGSSNAQNRDIQEITFGFNQTLWKNARYGAINYMMQYEYLLRAPWYYAAGQAGGKGTHDSTVYVNLRYTLPGAMPNFN